MLFTGYSLLFVAGCVVSLLGTVLSYKRLSMTGAGELTTLLSVATYWTFWIIFETAATTPEMKLFWSKVSYPAVVSVPVFYYIFALRFTGGKRFSNVREAWPLFIVPFTVFLLALTNESHHLIWSSVSPINPDTNLLIYNHGPAFFVLYVSYSYLMLFLAAIRIIGFLLKHENVYRSQGWFLFLASVFPFISSIIYLTDLNPVPGLDLAPGSFLIGASLFVYALLRTHLLEMIPIARETLVEILNDGILALDGKNRILDINPSAIRFLGIEGSKPIGAPLHTLPVGKPDLREALLSKQSYDQFQLIQEGNTRYFRIEKLDLKKDVKSRLIVVYDITERINRQKKIQSVQERMLRMYQTYRLMADNVPELIWAKDLNLNYLFVNETLCRHYLKADNIDEPIGKSERFFLDRIRELRLRKEWSGTFGLHSDETDQLVLSTMKPLQYDESGLRYGLPFYLDIRKTPMFDEEGKLLGLVGIARDVTPQKQAEKEIIAAKERAEESDRLKTAFLANLSHEVRTPMNSILGFVSLLQEKNLTPDEKQEYIDTVKAGGERLINTINDIIDISRIETGQISLKYMETDLTETVNMLLSLYTRDAERKGINLIFSGIEGGKSTIVFIDKMKLFNVLSNLIKNAIKYTEAGFVEFGCSFDANTFSFYVKDTGIGIPEEKFSSIFNRFVQADDSYTRRYEGNGLGLSISRSYVELMGGSIWLESEEGKGSTFHVQLPVSPNHFEENMNAGEDAVVSEKQKWKILVVEDDQGNFDYLRYLLQRLEYEVYHTITGFEAIELCRQQVPFDLVLMDIKLPGIDGYETSRRIRSFSSDIPIIAVSAFAYAEDREKAIQSGCNDYLTKPVDKNALNEMLAKYLHS